MGVRNYLIKGVSGTGKTSVATELQRRGYHVIHGDRELAYRGDPDTGEPLDGSEHERFVLDVAFGHKHHLWNADRPAREVVLARLLEVLMIEALRSASASTASPGLLRGLADARLAAALRQMHYAPARPWTVAQLAKEAAMSRSAFFERFNEAVGMPPMEYLLEWRMALAKDGLRRGQGKMAELAARVGYSSASTFSTAFTRHVGQAPSRYAQATDARDVYPAKAGNHAGAAQDLSIF